FVDLAGFDVARDVVDALDGQIGGVLVDGGDVDRAIILDVDAGAGLVGDAANRGTALADHVANLLDVDLHGEDARRPLRDLGTRLGNGLLHGFEDVQPAFARLGQRRFHDLAGNAADLDVHLQGGDALGAAGDLEVHVAEVVLVTENVGEHGELVVVLD